MGADIHSTIEVRDKKTGEWVAYTRGNDGRNYRWFNIIAGVRGSGENTICDPKGIPKDAGLVVRRELDSDISADLHSHSWLSLAELSEAYRRYIDEMINDKEDDITELVTEAAGKKMSYKDKMLSFKNSNNFTYDDILPEHDNIRWMTSMDDNLDMKPEDYLWYDDIRYVFAFDN